MSSTITSSDDTYVTNPARSSILFQAFPGLYFYLRMFSLVFRASRKARKKQFLQQEWIQSSLAIIRHMETVDCRFFVEGKKNFIGLEGPCVFVGNHMSTLETFALGAIIRPHRPVTFVIKDSLVRYPVFKHIMLSRDPIVVSRRNPRQDLKVVMEQGMDRLSRGMSVIVFPQSVRTVKFEPSGFNSIGVKLARKAGVPVVPLALKTDAWSMGWPFLDFGRIRPERFIHFSFGRPMHIQGNGKKEHLETINFISTRLAGWQKISALG